MIVTCIENMKIIMNIDISNINERSNIFMQIKEFNDEIASERHKDQFIDFDQYDIPMRMYYLDTEEDHNNHLQYVKDFDALIANKDIDGEIEIINYYDERKYEKLMYLSYYFDERNKVFLITDDPEPFRKIKFVNDGDLVTCYKQNRSKIKMTMIDKKELYHEVMEDGRPHKVYYDDKINELLKRLNYAKLSNNNEAARKHQIETIDKFIELWNRSIEYMSLI